MHELGLRGGDLNDLTAIAEGVPAMPSGTASNVKATN